MTEKQVAAIIVAGPTGSGKSALALALAERFAGTIINADSQQIYRDLAILTVRPNMEETARVPHRLYGIIDAAENCSVGQWLKLARVEIAAASAAGRVPILVGGTGLYIEALLRGLAELPPIPEALREEARALYARLGGAAFHAELARLDPGAAARLPSSDRQRLTRAYEVAKATGVPLSEWQRRQSSGTTLNAAVILLLPPRDELYAICDARVLHMLEAGAAAELRALLGRRLSPRLSAMKAVGVRELGAWLRQEASKEEAVAAMQQATRHYVKRQFTWFRRRLPETGQIRKLVLNAQFSESLLPEIFSFIRGFLLTESD